MEQLKSALNYCGQKKAENANQKKVDVSLPLIKKSKLIERE